MIKIHTFYDATVSTPELNSFPSKTDASFYEPLNVLVQKIIRGERVKMSSLDSYEFADVGKVSDDIFDGDASDADIDDITDIDTLINVSNYTQNLNKKAEQKRASDAPHIASASKQGEAEQQDFVEKAEA